MQPMQRRHTLSILVRGALTGSVLATALSGGVASADHGAPHGRANGRSDEERGQPGQQGQQGQQGAHANEGGGASLWHRKAFPGIVSSIKTSTPKGFDLLVKVGGEEHTIAVTVDEDTAYRGKDHGEIEDAAKPADAFFALLVDLHDNSGTEVRANVRGELSEDNGKLKLLAERVSLREVAEGEDEA